MADVTGLLGVTVDNVYGSAVRGYSGRMTAATAARLARDPRVVLVQPDGVASIVADFNGRPGGGAASTTRSPTSPTTARTWTSSRRACAGPHVAGAAALYKSAHPTASPSAVRTALRAAGTSNWNTATDQDGTHEPLLNVASF